MAAEPTAAKIKTFLKGKGHQAEKVDDTKLKWNTKAARIAAILELHGVTETQYGAGKLAAGGYNANIALK